MTGVCLTAYSYAQDSRECICDSSAFSPPHSLHFWLRGAIISIATLLILAACDNDGFRHPHPYTNQPPSNIGEIHQPTAMNLYPSASGNRLYVFVTGVGSQTVSIPLPFDTGSAGLTLPAQSILPSSMVNVSGFTIPADEFPVIYNGITITSQQGTRSYGGKGGTVEHGNIGYAQITFGDASGALTTKVMPVLLFYSVSMGNAEYTPDQLNQLGLNGNGWFGVDTEADAIAVGSLAPGATSNVCSADETGACYVVSVLKYLKYSDNIDAGFRLSPAPLQNCQIASPAGCPPKPVLTIGLNSESTSAFSKVTLTCPTGGYLGPQTIYGYLVCQKAIPDTTVALEGIANGTLIGSVLFDSGSPDNYLYPPKASFPASIQPGIQVSVTLPSGFNYTYLEAASGPLETTVNPNANNEQTHMGVGYFTAHYFLIDYSANTEGWM